MGRQKSSAAPSLHNENQEGAISLRDSPFEKQDVKYGKFSAEDDVSP